MSRVIPSTSGVRYDTSPIGLKKNWVTDAGGLPDFVRAVAHALIRNGHSESGAIQMAIGVIKDWAAGGGKVTAKTRAKAAATVAEWEAMKASTGRSDEELSTRASGAFASGHAFEGNQWVAGPNAQANQQQAAQALGMTTAQAYLMACAVQAATGQKVTGVFTNSQLAAVTSGISAAQAKLIAQGGSKGKAAAAKAASALKAAQTKAAAQQLHQAALAKAAASPVTAGSVSNANLTNGLSAANRTAMMNANSVPPAGYSWNANAPGGPTLVPATPLAAAQAAHIAATTKVAAGTPGVVITPAVSTTGTGQPLQPGAAKPTQVAASSGKPATAASQKQANAINTLPPAAKAKAQLGVPPAGFMWQGGNLVPSHRSDDDLATRATQASGEWHNSDGLSPDATKDDLIEHIAIDHKMPAVRKITTSFGVSRDALDKIHERDHVRGGECGAHERSEPLTELATRAMAEFASTGPGPGTSITTPDASGAGNLLPVGPSKKVADRVVQTIGPHRFAGSNLDQCATCKRPIGDPIHSRKYGARQWDPASQNTSLVPDHGTLPPSLTHLSNSAKQTSRNDQDRVAGLMEKVLRKHFGDQRKSVLSRLTGKRGAQMIRRAAQGPEFPAGGDTPDPTTAPPELVAGASAAAVDPQAIFDDTFWTAQLAAGMEGAYQVAGATAVGRAAQHAALPVGIEDASSLAAVNSILQKRADMASIQVTETTRKAIFGALQQGMAEGEGVSDLANRINAIFDNADEVRAKMIAQTEAVGALNAATQHYAANLPDDTVGGKIWLSHHDGRTRPTHRMADGQIVTVSKPFWVGGFPMMQPGDHSAPPSETINCRCSLALVPTGLAKPILGPSGLEGLIPSTSLAQLDAILAKQEANNAAAVATTAANAAVNA